MMRQMYKTKILIADDHALVREGISAILRLYDDVEVVAEASDGIEAIKKIKTCSRGLYA